MPKVSVMILTKNRAEILPVALLSVRQQSFKDYEIILVNDGSTDRTKQIIENLKNSGTPIQDLHHLHSLGITLSRQEALLASHGEYISVLDDDDEWTDKDKLKKQVEYLNKNRECVIVGGSIKSSDTEHGTWSIESRPENDRQIRRTMLFRNNFFTSTVMFRKNFAIKSGGFIKDEVDFGEDYDLWLRMGKLGKMHNFQEVFTLYRLPDYNKEKFRAFLAKQLRLVKQHRQDYPYYRLANLILKLRLSLIRTN